MFFYSVNASDTHGRKVKQLWIGYFCMPWSNTYSSLDSLASLGENPFGETSFKFFSFVWAVVDGECSVLLEFCLDGIEESWIVFAEILLVVDSAESVETVKIEFLTRSDNSIGISLNESIDSIFELCFAVSSSDVESAEGILWILNRFFTETFIENFVVEISVPCFVSQDSVVREHLKRDELGKRTPTSDRCHITHVVFIDKVLPINNVISSLRKLSLLCFFSDPLRDVESSKSSLNLVVSSSSLLSE